MRGTFDSWTGLPIRCLFAAIAALAVGAAIRPLRAEIRNAGPSNYQNLMRRLQAGDTLSLRPGKYPRLSLANLNGTPEAWITITGPESGLPAMIEGAPDFNTVEIINCSYVSIENLVIDSRGIPGVFGLSARGGGRNHTHDIRIEGNTFIGQNGNQQTDGISTKTPTWGWVIRRNIIMGAGTGLYLGDSDGSQPFVGGVVENNLVEATIGYNMEIKDQFGRAPIPGMPTVPVSTIIRNNVFIKDDQSSPDGDRPNLLVGAFPDSGPGSLDMYEIYGNYFVHNHREALFQGSGRVSLHDNIFIDGPPDYPAVDLMKQNRPLKVALVYNNTIYTGGEGVRFDNPALNTSVVAGNLVFAAKPISGPIGRLSGNITGPPEGAPTALRAPSYDPAAADFYPLPGKCQGPSIDLSPFRTDADYTLDFNGVPKTRAKGAVVFRGAYAGEGDNPGAKPGSSLKAPYPPLPKTPRLVWITPAEVSSGGQARLTLTGANLVQGASVAFTGGGVNVSAATGDSDTQLTVALTIAPGAEAGIREVTVSTPHGVSNPLQWRVLSGAPPSAGGSLLAK